ncbi:MAG: ThiF family adenylyltransferase [Bdellovibrionales bacterium]|nr:ThiF family adenylyltransferase [Bdellovibrionales bacterium]
MSIDAQLDKPKVTPMNIPNASPGVPFDYGVAFSRTLGWITGYEAQVLRKKRVAVAGLGGVGGHYCEVLARLGVGAFTVADFDRFGIENMNRQAGASMNTLGEPKADVMTRRVLAINPEADVRVFDKGLTAENIDEFLKDVDLYVDGLDFFVLDLRFQLFEALERKGIPYVTVAPLGMGASMVYFDQKSMGFKKYFALKPGLSPWPRWNCSGATVDAF